MQANSRTIDTHLGGGTLGHLGLIVSDASYAMISPEIDAGTTLWVIPTAPGRATGNTDGTSPRLAQRETYRIYTSVQQALKQQIITVFEPMYLDVLNDEMVGFAKISARSMLDHLFTTYGNITTVDLENNFEHMRRAWDP
jgi:hypothetical protein